MATEDKVLDASAVAAILFGELAAEYSLSIYDTAYLWLAFSLEAGLITLDRRLRSAWKRSRRDR